MSEPTWRAVEQIMGLPVSIALRGRHAGSAAGNAAWAAVVADLRTVDRAFSTYRTDSWISRHNAGELLDPPPEAAEVLALAEAARRESDGAFDVRRTGRGPVGSLDLDGVVKGWAVQRAAARLRDLDDTDSCLSGGGDLVCWTAEPDGAPWRIGIEDPLDPRGVIARLPVSRGAVATSGRVHRGDHIVDARTGRPPVGGPVSVTVVGAELAQVDIDATVAFAQGGRAVAWLRARPDHAGLVVWGDGRVETWRSAA
ncbi:FAD:protein FMN transferase [Nocardioides sp. URHA0020]|uniref:FAD:protein FMN transferase n=1 Tax=Nocardioides sp. URHA0020 TaxID=1380392 RepID=UPI0004905CF4|nr:FAD:protein FMN transferase [Nocardioides sp. URHA0020]